jgi:uncharacterized protein YecE (DUF72 family)
MIVALQDQSEMESSASVSDPGSKTDNRILVGTSGFAYGEWRGIFYPAELPSKRFLSYYAGHFRTTEINNTFYRMPTPQLTQAWYAEVPADFSFTLKLSRKITHFKKLKDVSEEMDWFLASAAYLKEKLGPILVQLPPFFRKDLALLREFLGQFAARARVALEFRHESWFEEEVYQLLREHNSALAVVEREEKETSEAVKIVTGTFAYMRLRKGDYSETELLDWARWIREQAVPVYCYLKHDERAPVLANQLLEALDRV